VRSTTKILKEAGSPPARKRSAFYGNMLNFHILTFGDILSDRERERERFIMTEGLDDDKGAVCEMIWGIFFGSNLDPIK